MKFNHTLTTIAAGLVLSLGAQGANPAGTPVKSGHEIPLIGNALQRGGTSLNGEWHYIVDVQEQGYYDYRMRPTNSGFFRNAKPQRPEDLIEYDFDKAATMHVPGDWNTQDPRLFFYEGTVWYMRRFNYSPKADKRTLLNMAKDLGCNYVRLAHYPHNEWMVREAERMGILVWSEIPCYWTIDWTNSATFDNAAAQLRDMISRDRNRANVIIWSIANETPHSPERDAFLGKLADLARAYDPTRLISMAMEITGTANHVNRVNDNMHEKVDIVSFNEYIGWYAPAQQASLTSWEIPYNKPVIVSEFGGGAQYGYHGEGKLAAKVLREWYESKKESYK